jgi:hypothetical protein
MGISSSLPLMVTLEQRGFYLVTSLPFYAIGIAAISASHISAAVGKINIQKNSFKRIKWISVFLLCCSVIFTFLQIGKCSRDEEMLHDVHLIGKIIPKGTILGSVDELWRIWSLQEYLIRHYYICQDNKITTENDYLLLESEKNVPPMYKVKKINITTKKYHLYKTIK